MKCFGKESPVVARAFASIPSVNMWDDHVSSVAYSRVITGNALLMSAAAGHH